MANASTKKQKKRLRHQFKATRDNEIIPAILKGNAADAKKVADGVQYERLSKITPPAAVTAAK